jgi:putative peptidoglycan lipid II flippase
MLIKSIFTNSFGILFSRILGFIRDLLTASILGANIYSDMFFVAFKLPNLFRRIFAEGAFTQAFLPSYSKSKNKAIFSTYILVKFFLIITLISIFINIFSELVTSLIAMGFDENMIEQTAPLLAINFYYLNFIFVVTFLATLLQYKNHFATTSFSTALLNISLIVALLIAEGMEKYDIVYYMSWAVLVGGALQLLVHVIAIKKLSLMKIFTYGFYYVNSTKEKISTEVKNFNKLFLPSVFGSSTAHISAFLDTWLASFLVSGSISYLYYSNRVFQLPLALFAIATSIALFPMVAKAIKQKDSAKAQNLMKKSSLILFSILGISTAIGIVFSQEIVWLLFERGEFTNTDTIKTATVLSMYLIGLLPFGLAKIFSMYLFAKEKHIKMAKISAYALGFNIVFSLILIIPYEAQGLALASSLSGIVLFILTYREYKKTVA